MNISLTNGSGMHPTEPDDCDLLGDVEEHQEILRGVDDIQVVGPAVLVPEGPGYPGSYQVWSPVRYKESFDFWAYVDTEGTIQYRENLHTVDEMRGRA